MAIPEETLTRLRKPDLSLTELNLSKDIQSDEDVAVLVEILLTNPYVKKLTIHGRVTDKGAQLLSKCRHLTFLDISYSREVTDVGISAFRDTTLEQLVAAFCPVTNEGLRLFLDNTSLLTLNFYGAKLDKKLLDKMAVRLSRNKDERLRHMSKSKLIEKVNKLLAQILQEDHFHHLHDSDANSMIAKLPPDLRMPAKNYRDNKFGNDMMTLMLVHNIAKLGVRENDWELKEAIKYSECHRGVEFSQYQKLMQFKPAVPARKRSRSRSLSPPPSPSISRSSSPSLSPSIGSGE